MLFQAVLEALESAVSGSSALGQASAWKGSLSRDQPPWILTITLQTLLQPWAFYVSPYESVTPGVLFWKPVFHRSSRIYIYQQSWNVKRITRRLESTGSSLIWSCKPHLHMPFRNAFGLFHGSLVAFDFNSILIQVGGWVTLALIPRDSQTPSFKTQKS